MQFPLLLHPIDEALRLDGIVEALYSLFPTLFLGLGGVASASRKKAGSRHMVSE